MVVPKELQGKLAIIKEAYDLNCNSFAIGLVSNFLEDNKIEDHIAYITKIYKKKRDIMAKAIDEHLSDYITYQMPEAGIYFWLETVEDIDSMEIYKMALGEKLIIMPGSAFAVSGKIAGRNGLRLNFSYPGEGEIKEGIRKLGKVLKNLLKK